MDTLTKTVSFRVSIKDYDHLQKYADAAGQTVSEYVRTQAFRLYGGGLVSALELPNGERVPVDQLKDARFILFPGDFPDLTEK